MYSNYLQTKAEGLLPHSLTVVLLMLASEKIFTDNLNKNRNFVI